MKALLLCSTDGCFVSALAPHWSSVSPSYSKQTLSTLTLQWPYRSNFYIYSCRACCCIWPTALHPITTLFRKFPLLCMRGILNTMQPHWPELLWCPLSSPLRSGDGGVPARIGIKELGGGGRVCLQWRQSGNKMSHTFPSMCCRRMTNNADMWRPRAWQKEVTFARRSYRSVLWRACSDPVVLWAGFALVWRRFGGQSPLLHYYVYRELQHYARFDWGCSYMVRILASSCVFTHKTNTRLVLVGIIVIYVIFSCIILL